MANWHMAKRRIPTFLINHNFFDYSTQKYFDFRYHTKSKAAEDVEYPAYGVSGSGRDISPTSADRKLAQVFELPD